MPAARRRSCEIRRSAIVLVARLQDDTTEFGLAADAGFLEDAGEMHARRRNRDTEPRRRS
jgi:hypothetical protein